MEDEFEGGITDVGEDQAVVVEHRPALDRQLGCVQAALVTVEHVELGRLEPGQLTAQLTADVAARTRHQHPGPGDVARDRSGVDLRWMATEQVGLVQRTDVGLTDAGEQLIDGGQHEQSPSAILP